jgi:hypothetical protein
MGYAGLPVTQEELSMVKRMVLAAAAVYALGAPANAQQYPSRPVTMIVPFAAGGPQDTIGRVVAQRMGAVLGQQVVVENVGGAGGSTGSLRVAKAAPDGYTFVLGSVGTHAQNQTLYKRPLYDAAKDFTPVAFIAQTPIALIVRKDLPVRTRTRCRSAPPAPVRRRISVASCSTPRSALRSRMCRIAARVRRCRTCKGAVSIICATSSTPRNRRSSRER